MALFYSLYFFCQSVFKTKRTLLLRQGSSFQMKCSYFSSEALDAAAAFDAAVKSSAIRADFPRNARKK